MEKSKPPLKIRCWATGTLPSVAIGGNPRTSRQDVARDVRICAGCGWADIHINPCVSRLKREYQISILAKKPMAIPESCFCQTAWPAEDCGEIDPRILSCMTCKPRRGNAYLLLRTATNKAVERRNTFRNAIRHLRFLDVQAQTEHRSEGSGLPGSCVFLKRHGRIFLYGVK